MDKKDYKLLFDLARDCELSTRLGQGVQVGREQTAALGRFLEASFYPKLLQAAEGSQEGSLVTTIERPAKNSTEGAKKFNLRYRLHSTPVVWSVLYEMGQIHGMSYTYKDLAKKLDTARGDRAKCSMNTLRVLIGRLREDGYVARVATGPSTREAFFALTPLGELLLQLEPPTKFRRA